MGNCIARSSGAELFHAVTAGDKERALDRVHETPLLLFKQRGDYKRTVWHECAANGQLDVLRALVHHVRDTVPRDEQSAKPVTGRIHPAIRDAINSFDRDGYPALILACKAGHHEMATFLLDQGADAWQGDRLMGRSALHHAAGGNHAACVDAILGSPHVKLRGELRGKEHKLVDYPTHAGYTPLHYAAAARAAAAAAALFRHGADPNARCGPGGFDWVLYPEGSTALHICAWRNCLDIAMMLLQYWDGNLRELDVTDPRVVDNGDQLKAYQLPSIRASPALQRVLDPSTPIASILDPFGDKAAAQPIIVPRSKAAPLRLKLHDGEGEGEGAGGGGDWGAGEEQAAVGAAASRAGSPDGVGDEDTPTLQAVSGGLIGTQVAADIAAVARATISVAASPSAAAAAAAANASAFLLSQPSRGSASSFGWLPADGCNAPTNSRSAVPGAAKEETGLGLRRKASGGQLQPEVPLLNWSDGQPLAMTRGGDRSVRGGGVGRLLWGSGGGSSMVRNASDGELSGNTHRSAGWERGMSGPLSSTGPQPQPHSGRLPQLLRRGSSKRVHPTGPVASITSVSAAAWRPSASGGGALVAASAAGPLGTLPHGADGGLTAAGTHGAGQALPSGSKSHHNGLLRTQQSNPGTGAGAAAATLGPVRYSANGVGSNGLRDSRDSQVLSPACQPSTPPASPHAAARLSSAGIRNNATAAGAATAATDVPYGMRPSAGGTAGPGDANDSQRSNVFSIPRHYSSSSISSQAPDSRVASPHLELITPSSGPVGNGVLPSTGAASTRVSYTGVGGRSSSSTRAALSPQGPPGQPMGSAHGIRSPQSRLGQRALMAGGLANQGSEDRGVGGAGRAAPSTWLEPAVPAVGLTAGSIRYGRMSAPDADALGGRLAPGGAAVVAWGSSQDGGAGRALARGQVVTAGEEPAVGGVGSVVLDEIQPASEDGSRRGGREGGRAW